MQLNKKNRLITILLVSLLIGGCVGDNESTKQLASNNGLATTNSFSGISPLVLRVNEHHIEKPSDEKKTEIYEDKYKDIVKDYEKNENSDLADKIRKKENVHKVLALLPYNVLMLHKYQSGEIKLVDDNWGQFLKDLNGGQEVENKVYTRLNGKVTAADGLIYNHISADEKPELYININYNYMADQDKRRELIYQIMRNIPNSSEMLEINDDLIKVLQDRSNPVDVISQYYKVSGLDNWQEFINKLALSPNELTIDKLNNQYYGEVNTLYLMALSDYLAYGSEDYAKIWPSMGEYLSKKEKSDFEEYDSISKKLEPCATAACMLPSITNTKLNGLTLTYNLTKIPNISDGVIALTNTKSEVLDKLHNMIPKIRLLLRNEAVQVVVAPMDNVAYRPKEGLNQALMLLNSILTQSSIRKYSLYDVISIYNSQVNKEYKLNINAQGINSSRSLFISASNNTVPNQNTDVIVRYQDFGDPRSKVSQLFAGNEKEARIFNSTQQKLDAFWNDYELNNPNEKQNITPNVRAFLQILIYQTSILVTDKVAINSLDTLNSVKNLSVFIKSTPLHALFNILTQEEAKTLVRVGNYAGVSSSVNKFISIIRAITKDFKPGSAPENDYRPYLSGLFIGPVQERTLYRDKVNLIPTVIDDKTLFAIQTDDMSNPKQMSSFAPWPSLISSVYLFNQQAYILISLRNKDLLLNKSFFNLRDNSAGFPEKGELDNFFNRL